MQIQNMKFLFLQKLQPFPVYITNSLFDTLFRQNTFDTAIEQESIQLKNKKV